METRSAFASPTGQPTSLTAKQVADPNNPPLVSYLDGDSAVDAHALRSRSSRRCEALAFDDLVENAWFAVLSEISLPSQMKNVFLMPVFVAMVLTGCVSRHEIYKHPPTALVQQVGALAPLVEAYVLENQAIALKEGIPLAASQMAMAQEMGILRARDVRILYVEKLPFPSDPVLATAAKKYRYDPSAMVGYAYGHGIWIANGVKNDPTVLTHELIHVRQMEQTGLREHIRLYLTQLVVFGYREAPIEIEAYQEAERLR